MQNSQLAIGGRTRTIELSSQDLLNLAKKIGADSEITVFGGKRTQIFELGRRLQVNRGPDVHRLTPFKKVPMTCCFQRAKFVRKIVRRKPI